VAENLSIGDTLKTARPKINTMNAEQLATKGRVDTIVASAGSSNTEIVDARKTFPVLGARLDDMDSQLTELQIPEQTLPTSKLAKIKRKITPPEDFTWTNAPINVYKDGAGEVTTDLDITDYQHVGAGKVYYVNLTTGIDTNDGLTPGTALKSVHVARAKPDVDIIEITEGYYEDLNAFGNLAGTSIYKNLTIRAAAGANVILSTKRALAWTKTAGKTYVYEASRTQVANVYDAANLDANGDYTKLTSVASIDLCDSTPNSYYYATPMLYVHTFNNRAADVNVIVFLDLKNFKCVGNYRTFLENIKLYGGNEGAAYIGVDAATDSTMFVAKGCEFKYSNGGNGGLAILGADAITEGCKAGKNYADGFNYHASAGRVSKFIEVDSIGRSNGLGRGTNTDNGSTAHDGCKGIRVNGLYHENEGPNVHDINTGTESWNIGCDSHKSLATDPARETNYRIELQGKMWIDSCIGYESNQNLYVSSDSALHERNCLFDDGLQVINGTKTKY
jgi:hypothetical protein